MVNDEKSSVLIVGTYSGLNKGDRIMQLVSAKSLEELGLKPIISCPFPQIDIHFYPKAWVQKSGRRKLVRSYALIFTLLLLPMSMRYRLAKHHRELALFANAKFIVDTSGDMLTEDYGPHVALSHLVPLIYSKLLNKDLVILAQSIGPFKRLGWLFDKVLASAKVITARDDITHEYLTRRGLINVEKAADLGFLLEPKPVSETVHALKESSQSKCLIGICPSALFFRKFRRGDYKSSVTAFAEMLDRIAVTHNAEYIFIPHVMTPSGKMDDDVFSRELSEELTAHSSVLEANLTPAEVKYVISKLSMVVTFRMHGAIAALDSLVPTIAISYSHKTDGLFAKLGITEWVIQNDDSMLDSLETKVGELFDCRDSVTAHLSEKVPELRKQASKNIDVLKALAA